MEQVLSKSELQNLQHVQLFGGKGRQPTHCTARAIVVFTLRASLCAASTTLDSCGTASAARASWPPPLACGNGSLTFQNEKSSPTSQPSLCSRSTTVPQGAHEFIWPVIHSDPNTLRSSSLTSAAVNLLWNPKSQSLTSRRSRMMSQLWSGTTL